MKLNFGGNQGVRQRQATFELGPLYCSGKAERDLHGSGYLNSSPTSCRDLLLKGITQVRSVCKLLINPNPTVLFLFMVMSNLIHILVSHLRSGTTWFALEKRSFQRWCFVIC